jgi:hypothetical protein
LGPPHASRLAVSGFPTILPENCVMSVFYYFRILDQIYGVFMTQNGIDSNADRPQR